MSTLGMILISVVVIIHFLFAALEIVGWSFPKVHKDRFGFETPEAEKARPLVANAGFYNGFLALGLVWSMVPPVDLEVASFFLVWASAAGAFGALTLRKPLVFVLQSVPALLALVGARL
jgi:putative membrane protein